MAKKTFAILGATGHIGGKLAEELLRRGHHVKAVGRNQEKLEALKSKGAEVFIVDMQRSRPLIEAIKGVDGLLSLIPPNFQTDDYESYQDSIGEAIVATVKGAKIPSVVNISSIGAQHRFGTGPIKGLHRQEERLNAVPGLNVVHLRPSYFMENFFAAIEPIKKFGVFASAMKSDLPVPMIATADIAHRSAEFFEELDFKGNSIYEFTGPREIPFQEVAQILGKAIQKSDLRYKELILPEAVKLRTSFGLPEPISLMYEEMDRAFNQGKIVFTQPITDDRRTHTSLEEFSKEFAQLYKGAKLEKAGARR